MPSRFWYKFPNGESPFDISSRVNLFIQKTCNYDSTVLIISHVHILKVLKMLLLNENLEWYEQENWMKNCEMQVIENGQLIQRVLCKI